MIIVRACITMVGPCSLIVLKEWGRPDSCCTQCCNMVERIDNALNITAETTVYILLIGWFCHLRKSVIALIAIYKTVGHDQVDHIAGVEALTLATAFTTGVDGVIYLRAVLALFEGDTIRTCLIHCQIHKEVVWTLGVVLALNCKTSTLAFDNFAILELLDSHLCISEIFAVEQEGEWAVHFCPPAEGLCAVNAWFSTEGNRTKECCKKKEFFHCHLWFFPKVVNVVTDFKDYKVVIVQRNSVSISRVLYPRVGVYH